MWYDIDTSPQERKKKPRLWGATPDTSRGSFFFVLVMSGALQIMAKCFSSALLLIANSNYFLAYIVGDHVLFQLYLASRGDHRSFRPGVGVLLSVVLRFGQKVVADFTSCWLVRTPFHLHNVYFLFNQLTAHASVFISVRVYVRSGLTDLPERMLWSSAGSLFAAWALMYVVQARERNTFPPPNSHLPIARRYIILACMVKPEYRYQFYTNETAADYIRAEHVGAKNDEEKMGIFTFNEVKWRSYKDEVRDFTHANWARWKEEQPAWFNEELIQRVPDEFIPAAAVAELNA
jgi:hypothetical protein